MNAEHLKYSLKETGLICPSCLREKSTTGEVEKFIDQLKSLEYNPVSQEGSRSIYFEYAKEYKTDQDYLKVKWACDECLENETALISKTTNEQRKSDKPPVFAFFDLNSKCKKCQSEFVFKKGEWRYWIDELSFFHQTTKKFCENCQPTELLKKRLSTKIAEQRDLEFGEEYVDLTLEICRIYVKLDMKDKGKGYLKKEINRITGKEKNDLKIRMQTAYFRL